MASRAFFMLLEIIGGVGLYAAQIALNTINDQVRSIIEPTITNCALNYID